MIVPLILLFFFSIIAAAVFVEHQPEPAPAARLEVVERHEREAEDAVPVVSLAERRRHAAQLRMIRAVRTELEENAKQQA